MIWWHLWIKWQQKWVGVIPVQLPGRRTDGWHIMEVGGGNSEKGTTAVVWDGDDKHDVCITRSMKRHWKYHHTTVWGCKVLIEEKSQMKIILGKKHPCFQLHTSDVGGLGESWNVGKLRENSTSWISNRNQTELVFLGSAEHWKYDCFRQQFPRIESSACHFFQQLLDTLESVGRGKGGGFYVNHICC